jgi:hypothetical protein
VIVCVFKDARFHPLWVVSLLSFRIDRHNQIGITSCSNPKHEGQPRMSCLLLPKKNRWRCTHRKAWGDVVDFVVVENAKLLPDPERFPPSADRQVRRVADTPASRD